MLAQKTLKESLIEELLQIPLKERITIHLTKREAECLSLWYHEHSVKEIGDFLGISANTAKNHINSFIKKFNCQKRIACYRRIKNAGVEPVLTKIYKLQRIDIKSTQTSISLVD